MNRKNETRQRPKQKPSIQFVGPKIKPPVTKGEVGETLEHWLYVNELTAERRDFLKQLKKESKRR